MSEVRRATITIVNVNNVASPGGGRREKVGPDPGRGHLLPGLPHHQGTPEVQVSLHVSSGNNIKDDNKILKDI